MIGFDERKQIILHLYKLIKESKMFQDYNDEDIKEAAIKSEQKAYDQAKNKEEYIIFMKAKFEKVTKNNTKINLQSINHKNNSTMTHNNISNHCNLDQKYPNYNIFDKNIHTANNIFNDCNKNNILNNNGFFNNNNVIGNKFSNTSNINHSYNQNNISNNNVNILGGFINTKPSNDFNHANILNKTIYGNDIKNFNHGNLSHYTNSYDTISGLDQTSFKNNNIKSAHINYNMNGNLYRNRFVNTNPKTNFTTYHRQGHLNNLSYISQMSNFNNVNNYNLHPESLQMKGNFIVNNDIDKKTQQKRPHNYPSPKSNVLYNNTTSYINNNDNNYNTYSNRYINPNIPYFNNNVQFINKRSCGATSPYNYDKSLNNNISTTYFQTLNGNKKINYKNLKQNDQNIKNSNISANINNHHSPPIYSTTDSYSLPSFHTPPPTHNGISSFKRNSLHNNSYKNNNTKLQEENVNELFHSISDIFKKEELIKNTNINQQNKDSTKTQSTKNYSNNFNFKTSTLNDNDIIFDNSNSDKTSNIAQSLENNISSAKISSIGNDYKLNNNLETNNNSCESNNLTCKSNEDIDCKVFVSNNNSNFCNINNNKINKNLIDTTNNIGKNIMKTKEEILKKTLNFYKTYKYKLESKSLSFMELYNKLNNTEDVNEIDNLTFKLEMWYFDVLNEIKQHENEVDYEEAIENIVGVFKSKKSADDNYVLDLVDK